MSLQCCIQPLARSLSTSKKAAVVTIVMKNYLHIKHKYVPKSKAPSENEIHLLQEFLTTNNKVVFLTGAGLSTESGIPDYRSEEVGLYARKNYKPMQYQDFISSSKIRQRYWARSFVGWPGYKKIQPSFNHHILANWELTGSVVHWLITQNVDHLHFTAGSRRLTELHGNLHETSCLTCKNIISRDDYQTQIEQLNSSWSVDTFEVATDGDVFLTDDQLTGFQVGF